MKVLYIAPLPPPITGHSIAAQVLLDDLQSLHVVEVVNLSINSKHNGSISLRRIFAVLNALRLVFKARNKIDVVYLTISESIAGNIKDLIIYLILFKVIGKTVIHLHGGSFKECVLERYLILRKLNSFFLTRINSAIISGPSHATIFDGMVAGDRLKTIPNFAQDYVFLDVNMIVKKFADINILRILYISGMTEGKGYLRLLKAYESLSPEVKVRVELNFAGKFDTDLERKVFENRIQASFGITYHGLVNDSKKAELFAQSHIFCLPTSYMEGQPISILEAYASGCVVLTTSRPGILDIFQPDVNGFQISSEDSESLKVVLESKCFEPQMLSEMALENRKKAERSYRANVFCKRVSSVITSAQG